MNMKKFKQIKKFNHIIIVWILLLIIGGCASNRPDTLTMKDLRIGTKGVEILFLPDNRDLKVFQEEQFPLNLLITNQGVAQTKSVYVLVGFEQDYVKANNRILNGKPLDPANNEVTSQLTKQSLDGRSPENLVGDSVEYEVEFESKKITLSKLQDTLVSGILCYNYGTQFEESVCIQPKNLAVNLQPACESKDVNVGSRGQGAPVGVTKLEVMSSLASGANIKTFFRIYIENLGDGNVLNDGAGSYICSAATSDIKPAKVWGYLKLAARLGVQDLKCRAIAVENTPYYLINLKDNKAEVVCESTVPAGSAYESPLLVEMVYDYTKTVTQKLIIEKI